MSTINLPELKRLAAELEAARTGLASSQRLLAAVDMKGDPRTVVLSLTTANDQGGDKQPHEFRLIEWNRYGYQKTPRVAAGRDALAAHIRRFLQEQVIAWTSKVEGLEFQIRKLAKAAGSAS